MDYNNMNNVATMWSETDKFKKQKGTHVTKFNVLKGIELQVGDKINAGKDSIGRVLFWRVEEITNTRQSSISAYNYVETMCKYIAEA